MTEHINKMNKTENVKDYKVYAVVNGKGGFVELGEIKVFLNKDNILPLSDILIGLKETQTLLKQALDENKRQNKYIHEALVKEIKKIKEEVGL